MLLLGLVLSLSTLCGGSLTAHADGSTPFGSFLLHTPTAITAADAPNFVWVVGDYNRDGRPDLYAIKVRRTTAPMLGSPMVEVHILDGATNDQSFLAHTTIPISAADAPNFVWAVGDYNRDGRPDLYAIKVRKTGSGMAEVHVLDGASNYQSFLIHIPTAITVGDAANFTWAVGDFNRDGNTDLYAIKVRKTGSGMAEVHVLDRASAYQTFLMHTPIAITAADAPNFYWAVGDYNRDGNADLYAVKEIVKQSKGALSMAMAEVHVLDRVTNYQSFLLHTPTAITAADAPNFTWALADYNRDGSPDLCAIKVKNVGLSGMVEMHTLAGQ
jgi:predicted GNAT superfamily acetyltransferase